MGTPNIKNGIVRAVKEIAIPSIIVLVSVFVAYNEWGGIIAGIVYVVLTGIALYVIYVSAKYWTTTYTAGFVFTGIIVVFTVPDVVSPLIHPVFNYMGTLVIICFLILIMKLFVGKLGLIKS